MLTRLRRWRLERRRPYATHEVMCPDGVVREVMTVRFIREDAQLRHEEVPWAGR